MFKHAAVIAVAVVAALVGAKGLAGYVSSAAAAGSTPEVQAAAAIYTPPTTGVQPAEVEKAADGHYWAEAEVNGRWVRCLVDTGATVVALRREDAVRLGIDPAILHYDVPVNTANGETRAAKVELDHVSVAGARVDHVSAMVVRDGLAAPLLGMSYLGRLSQFDATPTSLILRP